MVLTLFKVVEMPIKSLVRIFSVFSVFQAEGRLESKNCKNCLSLVAHKT